MYTIQWTGLQPTEAGWSPPSDTKQPHAQRCRDPLAFLTAVIAKMHARRAVHELTLWGVGRSQQSGESADSFEEFVHEWTGQLAPVGRTERIDHGGGRCQLPLGEPRALGNEGRVHAGFQSVEVLTELLAGLAGLEPGPAQLGWIAGFVVVDGEDGRHGALEPVGGCQIRQPGIDRWQDPVLSHEQ